MVTNFWTTYARWNEAIFNRYFSVAQTSVYLDIDDGMLEEIGKNGGFKLADGQMHEQFLEAVRPTLRLSPDFLEDHARRRRNWERAIRSGKPEDQDKIPPFIALLGFFSYTAYMMHNGGGFIAGNYHDRLFEAVYGRQATKPDKRRKDRLGNNFRKHIVDFYDSLARWLDFQKLGAYGLSTANPGPFQGRRFIGYPISQSIMGREDRAKLPECFRFGRLSPGDEISLDEMIDLLARWIPFSSLHKVAIDTFSRGDDDKTAVAEIALSELQAWSGSDVVEGEERVSARNLIIVMEKRSFPRHQIKLTLGFVDHDGPRAERTFAIKWSSQPIFNTSGEKLEELAFEESEPGLWLNRDQVSISDFLITEVHLENLEEKRQLNWPLSKVVVFEQNDELLQLVSTTRPTQGKSLSILAHQQEETLVTERIEGAQVEGTSYNKSGKLPGIPHGFILFEGVRLQSAEFDAIRPAPRIHLDGGVKIPGQRFWLSSRLPYVAFVSPAAAEECKLDLAELANIDNAVPRHLPVSGGLGDSKTADLSNEALSIGPYKLTLALGSGSGIINRSMNFGVCSADIASSDTRGLLTDQSLVVDHLHPAHIDMIYNGDKLEDPVAVSPDNLPPFAFDLGTVDEEIDPELAEAANWGSPLPVPEIHLQLKKGYRIKHGDLGPGLVIEIDENRVGITIDFEEIEEERRVTSGIIQILPPEIHLRLSVGDDVQHDEHGAGTVVELDDERVGVTIVFRPSGVTYTVTDGIIKILTPALHFELKVGDRIRHRQFGEGEVVEISADFNEVGIRFDSGRVREVTNGIENVLPPAIHFQLRVSDWIKHEEHGDGQVEGIDDDKTGITIVFADVTKRVTKGITRRIPEEIHMQLRTDDRIEHARQGFGTVTQIAADRVQIIARFDNKIKPVRLSRGIVRIIELERSELKPGDRVRHTKHGAGTIKQIEEDNETVLVQFGTGNVKGLMLVENGLYEKMKPAKVKIGHDVAVYHRKYGLGVIKGWAGPLINVEWAGLGESWVPEEDLEAP